MDEKRAREILGQHVWMFQRDEDDDEKIDLEGQFTADDLEAIAWVMRNLPRAKRP